MKLASIATALVAATGLASAQRTRHSSASSASSTSTWSAASSNVAAASPSSSASSTSSAAAASSSAAAASTSSNNTFPDSTAYLFLDYQNGILGSVGNDTAVNAMVSASQRLYSGVRSLKRNETGYYYPITAFSQVQFHPTYPELSPRNAAFKPFAQYGAVLTTSAQADFVSELTPQEGDLVFQKRRFDAAYNSELLTILRANEIDTVVLAGAYTSGVILATLRSLSDRDYTIYVVEDATVDPYSADWLLNEYFPRAATVLSTDQALAMMPEGPLDIPPNYNVGL
ncbi:Isochorismatase hydrolase [Saitoella complicata NRRL Y-17804]|uniref:Isochorismatase hydrolase n=1 Tax=Saitoella complicata (strain BCRC 22490 / CBS 7301 / JCM 7358 / NBRC 10748 / NRRL Y-17804) TaxID=698492 RepID=UPI000867992D|nr:Isochorismatase hydrolase [Saitoella complicata NRRL Y-17804]ODQ50231.1 Isochorismatase hydrolase [Saitoella complicata NRRL Y-17804]